MLCVMPGKVDTEARVAKKYEYGAKKTGQERGAAPVLYCDECVECTNCTILLTIDSSLILAQLGMCTRIHYAVIAESY